MRESIKVSLAVKTDILTRYLIDRQSLKQIHIDYRDKFSISYLERLVARIIVDNKVVSKVFKSLRKSKYKFVPLSPALGSKIEPYFETEEDFIYQHSTYGSLSIDEKIIYNEIH